jgi:hypothetical protein
MKPTNIFRPRTAFQRPRRWWERYG